LPEALLQAMNDKARELAMMQTHFADPSGLDSNNVSTARDLASLAYAIRAYPLISSLSTRERFRVTDWHAGADIDFHNTNYLVRKVSWEIELSKTGYTAEAGNCLLMRTTIAGRTLIIVLLSSWGKLSKFGDSNRIHAWLIDTEARLTDPASTAASTNK
jgi:serine-type D-Ala-D-Ala endopeptidase (penicillin-binding protein 7)